MDSCSWKNCTAYTSLQQHAKLQIGNIGSPIGINVAVMLEGSNRNHHHCLIPFLWGQPLALEEFIGYHEENPHLGPQIDIDKINKKLQRFFQEEIASKCTENKWALTIKTTERANCSIVKPAKN